MDELITQGQWWRLFPVPLLTFIFAIAGSWWGSRLGRTTEHWQWLRNEKRERYVTVLNDLNAMMDQLDADILAEDLLNEHPYDPTALTPLRLIQPRSIRNSIAAILDEMTACLDLIEAASTQEERNKALPIMDSIREKEADLIGLMRADLKVG